MPGAIAATSADIRMKNPAEAARAPLGATQTMVGTFEPISVSEIWCIDSISPPGVSSSRTRARAPARSALATESATNSWATGWMIESRPITTTGPVACAEAAAAAFSAGTGAAPAGHTATPQAKSAQSSLADESQARRRSLPPEVGETLISVVPV